MITAIFNNKMDSTIAYGLWQWDYGQVLRIKGIDFSQFAIEIHFSFNEDDEDSTIAVGVVKEVEYESTILDDGETKVTSETIQVLDVTIPKDFLWNRNKKNYTIYVFLHLSNEEIGHTVKKILLPVKIKARPTYPHASEDEALFHSTLEQINELAETTVENAKMAKSYAVGDTGTREGEDTDNAKYYAEQASVSLEEATLQAENAEQSANNAKEYEENAELSANKAKEYELSSKTNADNAQGYMDWAYEYKDNAQEYSISARDYRDEAESAKNISLQASIDTGKVRDEVKDIQTDVKNIQTQINNTVDSVDDTIIEINELAEQIETNAETVATNTEITNQNKVATDEAKATAEEVLASSRQINADVLEIKNQIIGFVDDATRIVDEGIAEHDTSSTAHDDIRQLIVGLNDRLNTVLNSDDETLDQLSEIVDYIKDNRDLIDTITTSKVNVSDIIDNLTTMSSNKPLSAKQGKILKDLIDAIKIPTKVSAFENDKGYLTEQVQTNWTEEDGTNVSFIQNKPSIASGIGTGSIVENVISGSSANEASGAYSHAEGVGTKATGSNTHTEGNGTTASGRYSHAEGGGTKALAECCHAEGRLTTASGQFCHAEGNQTTSSGMYSHSEGNQTVAVGKDAHAEGVLCQANANHSHAEGNQTIADGSAGHSEGRETRASAYFTHSEGYGTVATSQAQHVQGQYNVLDTEGGLDTQGRYAHIVGNGTSDSTRSNAHTLDWSGNAWYSGTVTADGTPTNDNDLVSKKWVEDKGYLAEQAQSDWTETDNTSTSYVQNKPSIAKGTGTQSIVEGRITGDFANVASGSYAHAEGSGTIASGYYSHAEGAGAESNGNCSHAEGGGTIASGFYSHSENYGATASGHMSHAEGVQTISGGYGSHAEGQGTKSASRTQHTQGKYNIEDTNETYAHIVGNGTDNDNRSNAHTLDWHGNAWYQGKVSADGEITEVHDLTPKSYVDDNLSKAFVEKSASGSVVTFDDGAEMPMKSVVVGIEPMQDLHGYDSPWVGGSGKNLLDADAVSSENKYIHCENGNTFTPSTDIEWRYSDYIEVTPNEVLFFGEINAPANGAGTAFYTEQKEYLSGFSATQLSNAGNVWTVPENAKYMRHSWRIDTEYNVDWQNTVYITLNSNPHTFSPYSNICPIEGWTGCEVVQTGKNLIPKGIKSVGTFKPTGGTITGSVYETLCFPVPKGRLHWKVDTTGVCSYICLLDDIPASGVTVYNNVTVTNRSEWNLDNSAGHKYMAMFTSNLGKTEEEASAYITEHEIRVTYGNDTEFTEPVISTIMPISWESEAGTVYGGTIDVVSGLLTVDKATAVFDGTETINNNYFPLVVFTKAFPVGTNGTPICSHVASSLVSYANSNRNTFQFRQCDTVWGVTSASELKTKFADEYANGHPVTVCYPLAEPITYQLSPNEIQSILGYNLVYSNVGDVDVAYLADIKIYVDEKIVQDDWNEADSNSNAYIQNKPSIKSGTGMDSIVEGCITGSGANVASRNYSHAEGLRTTSSGYYAHAEGFQTESSGLASHAECAGTIASGNYSHAESYGTKANGFASHSEGFETIASSASQHVQGKHNIEDANNQYVHIVGNGTSADNRSNAHTLDWSGNAWYAGKITAEGTPTESNDLVPKSYVDGTLTDYVKNTDYATADKGGVIKVPVYTNGYRGGMATIDGTLYSIGASIADIKLGIDLTKPLSAQNSTATTFYGLARASGDTTQSVSDNAIGNYTDEAKASIQSMLDVPSTEQLKDYTTLNAFYDDVINNTTSGNNIVSFNDGANNLPIQDLTINIEPNQDLHGYDSPWASGGGKNKCAPFEEATSTIQYRGIYVGDGTFTASSTAPWDASNATVFFLAGNVSSGASSSGNGVRPTVPVTQTAVDGYVTIAWRKVGDVDPTDYQTQIEAGSTATDYAPYSNICPISGWTGANVVKTGKNLMRLPTWAEILTMPFTNSYRNTPIRVKPNTDYYLSTEYLNGFSDKTFVVLVSPTKTNSAWKAISHSSQGVKNGVLRSSADGYLYLNTYGGNETMWNDLVANTHIQLEEGTAPTAFEPYNGTPITIDFGQTVYGGTVDVLTGKLTIDKVTFVLDGTTHYVSIGGGINENGYATAYSVIGRSTGLSDLPVGKYNAYLYATDKYPTTHDGGINASAEGVYCGSGNPYVRVAVNQDKIADTSTTQSITDGINAWLVSNPVQICYVVETPIEIQLDSHTLSTLLGYNNIYTDINSNISITYKANTKIYVDNKVMDNVPNLTSYVKNTNYATTTVGGVIKVSGTYGSGIDSNGILYIYKASDAEVKAGTNSYKPITPNSQHGSVFYGLAKASGDTTQASSANAIGVYTNDAKTKIKTMLDIPTKTSELTNDSNFINTSYQIYATDDDNGNVTIHFGIPS